MYYLLNDKFLNWLASGAHFKTNADTVTCGIYNFTYLTDILCCEFHASGLVGYFYLFIIIGINWWKGGREPTVFAKKKNTSVTASLKT